MTKSTVWTVLGVALAIVIAWFLVDLVFSVLGLLVKLVIVAVVAFLVYLLLHWLFTRSES